MDATAPVPPYTPGENPYILRSESSVPGRSMLALATPDFDSYLKANNAGESFLVAPAQIKSDIGIAGGFNGSYSSLTEIPDVEESFDAQAANTVFAGPESGAAAEPTFRALVAADIPTSLRATTFVSPITLPGETSGNPQIVVGTVGTIGGLINSLDNLYINSVPSTGRIVFGRGRSGFTGGVEAMRILDGVVIGGTTDPGATNLLVVGSTNTASLLTNSTTFNLVNAVPTTVNFAGAATALNMGSAASGVTLLNSPTVRLTGTLLEPATTYNTNIGTLSKKFLSVHAAELFVETLVAQSTMATVGGRILVGPTTSLIADLSTGSTTIDVKHNNLASGDRVYMESNGNVEFMAVTSGATTITGGFRYSVTRNLDGSGANAWFAGDAVFNTGQTGNGFIDIYSVRGVKAATEVGPTIVGNIRNSSTYNDWSPRWAAGNLNGLYGVGTDTYGAAFGVPSAQNLLILPTGISIRNGTTPVTSWDTTNGFQVLNSSSQSLIQLDISGNARFGRQTTNNANLFYNVSNQRVEFRGSTGGTTVQSYIDTDGSFNAGAGAVRLDLNGLALSSNIAGGQILFKDAGADVGWITDSYSSTSSVVTLLAKLKTADTTGLTETKIISENNNSRTLTLNLQSYGSAHATHAGRLAAVLGDTNFNFDGLVIGNTLFPTHMLDVYGTGWFQSDLTIGGVLNPDGAAIISGAVAAASSTPNAELVLGRSTSATTGNVLGQLSFRTDDPSSSAAGRQCAIKAITSESAGRASDLAFFTGTGAENSGVERARLTSVGNLKLGGTAMRATTVGTNHLDLFDGTAPAGTMTNGISLYSTAGECRVMDAAGNSTLISPHDRETNEWIFFSKNTVTGKVLRIDMERFMRKYGKEFIREYYE